MARAMRFRPKRMLCVSDFWKAKGIGCCGFGTRRSWRISIYRARLIIELDGEGHAFQTEADAVRKRFLEGEGYRVLRFWNAEVVENLDISGAADYRTGWRGPCVSDRSGCCA